MTISEKQLEFLRGKKTHGYAEIVVLEVNFINGKWAQIRSKRVIIKQNKIYANTRNVRLICKVIIKIIVH